MAKLKDVNTTDIAGAIRLGCQTMCRLFNADDDGIPFFDILALPEARMSFSCHHSEAQVPGRFLNALLDAEDALGIRIDEQAVDTIFRTWDPSDGWDYARLQDAHGLHGRSTTCTMSSLAQVADLTSDAPLLARVKAFYDNGLWHIRDQIGWSIETTNPGRNYGRGEANNTGDIVETALILGRWGYNEYYHDAERILRCHLLPCQLRDVSFIPEPPNPEGSDGKRDVAAGSPDRSGSRRRTDTTRSASRRSSSTPTSWAAWSARCARCTARRRATTRPDTG